MVAPLQIFLLVFGFLFAFILNKATSDTREIPQGSHWERMINTATRVNFSSTSGAPASELAV